MPIRAIAYVSDAAPGMTPDAAVAMIRNAADFNMQAGVTGILLHDGARFFQYIEGPEDGLAAVYGRILNATSHINIVELERARTGARHFPYGSMQLLPATAEEVDTLIAGTWDASATQGFAEGNAAPSGLDALCRFVLRHLPDSAPGHRP